MPKAPSRELLQGVKPSWPSPPPGPHGGAKSLHDYQLQLPWPQALTWGLTEVTGVDLQGRIHSQRKFSKAGGTGPHTWPGEDPCSASPGGPQPPGAKGPQLGRPEELIQPVPRGGKESPQPPLRACKDQNSEGGADSGVHLLLEK